MRLRCSDVGAYQNKLSGQWEGYLYTKVSAVAVHEARASQLVALLPQAKVRLASLTLTPAAPDP